MNTPALKVENALAGIGHGNRKGQFREEAFLYTSRFFWLV